PARLCLDLLRASRRRGGLPRLADALADQQLAADEEFLRREQVSRALMVLLDQLTPTQRVAYVLHDLFRVPFDEIAGVLDTTPTNAKKLASRARQRIAGASVVETAQTSDWRVVEAFLAAARDGDIDALVGVLAPDVVRTAAPELLPDGEAVTVHGHRAVAGEARLFADRVDVTIPMVVNGVPAAVLAPGGAARSPGSCSTSSTDSSPGWTSLRSCRPISWAPLLSDRPGRRPGRELIDRPAVRRAGIVLRTTDRFRRSDARRPDGWCGSAWVMEP